jgi:UDP-N-acetylmuramate dehydrogenase
MPVLDWKLPFVKGRYRYNVPLAPMVWFQVGGPADVVFRPESVQDLQNFMKNCPRNVPIFPLGVGSNVLVRDGGILGSVIKLGRGFTHVIREEDKIRVGAGALDRTVALFAAEQGLDGLSFLSGIPGTIGGAIKMNAGAYGSEIKDVLESCLVMTRSGELIEKKTETLGFSYRSSKIADDEIVVEATFKTMPSSRQKCQEKIDEIMACRAASQPVKGRTGGSTFKNPEIEHAWKLIDAAGCRGLRFGGAQVSEKHCNFMLNTEGALAYDIETLAEEVRRRVLTTHDVLLQWEIKRLGTLEKRPLYRAGG